MVGGEGGWFVAIIDESVGEKKMASSSATCALFTKIGHIAGNVEDHVSGMIVECGIQVGLPHNLITKRCTPLWLCLYGPVTR